MSTLSVTISETITINGKDRGSDISLDVENITLFSIDFLRVWLRFWSLVGLQDRAKLAILDKKNYDGRPLEPS